MPPLFPAQERLQDDIRGLIKGEVYANDITRHLHSTDAGVLQIQPRGVVFPADARDVAACVRYAAENRLPIHLRGAGTGVTGKSLGEGLVLDFSRLMNRLENITNDTAAAQPGISLHRLNTALADTQQHFAPIGGFAPATTLGSVLSRNEAGPRFLQYGLPSDYVQELDVVLANGDTVFLNREHLPHALEAPGAAEPSGIIRGIALARSITHGEEHRFADAVYRILSADNAGNTQRSYYLNEILNGSDGRLVDLARLILGSEGTLGIIVRAKVKTVSLPNRKAAAVLFFNSIEKAVQSLEYLLPLRPALCELIDRRRLALLNEDEPQLRHFLPVEAEAVLLTELETGSVAEPEPEEISRQRLQELIDTLQHRRPLCFHSLRVNTAEDFELFDRFLERSEHILFRMRGAFQPLPLFGSIAVSVTKIGDFIPELQGIMRRFSITVSLSGHLAQGQLRVVPIVNVPQDALPETLSVLADEVYELLGKYGGTGLLKPPFMVKNRPDALPLFRKIKEVFDPDNLLSPGNFLSPQTQQPQGAVSLRSVLADKTVPVSASTPQERQLRWKPERVEETARRCSGCGECFRNDKHSRFCPILRADRKEENAPRAKANFVNGILNGELRLEALAQEQSKLLADSCFQCRSCRSECPALTDISFLAFNVKCSYNAAHGLPLEDQFWSHLDVLLDAASSFSRPLNWLMKNRLSRWLLEKLLQIPQERHIPKLAKRSFLRRRQSKHRSATPKSGQGNVALFVDTYSNYFDTPLADLAVQILEEQGLNVWIPQRQRSSGLIPLALGNRDAAQWLAKQNVAVFSDLIRQGFTAVTLEPASASCLVQDYSQLTDGEDAAMLSANTVDFCTFLLQRLKGGMWRPEFKAVCKNVGYHTPCRSAARTANRIDAMLPAEELLRTIPGLVVRRIEQGCCGAPGTFGFKRKHYRQSLKIGMNLFRELRSGEAEYGVSDCNACRLQMEHGSKKKTLHPIHLIAEAMGLTTEFS